MNEYNRYIRIYNDFNFIDLMSRYIHNRVVRDFLNKIDNQGKSEIFMAWLNKNYDVISQDELMELLYDQKEIIEAIGLKE